MGPGTFSICAGPLADALSLRMHRAAGQLQPGLLVSAVDALSKLSKAPRGAIVALLCRPFS